MRIIFFLALTIGAISLPGCSSVDIGKIDDVMRSGGSHYSDYTGEDAAKIRVLYNSSVTRTSVEANGGRAMALQTGERTNKSMLGMRWDLASISLGMPVGEPRFAPKYNYTEIAVAPDRAVVIKFTYATGDPNVMTTTCDTYAVINPKAGKNYRVSFIMDNGRCWAESSLL